jgi:uncharacterized repeat protein (TIGR01451 family)
VTLSAQAAYIDRTIVVDGDMSDWYDDNPPPVYTPAGDITNNPGQFSEDGQDGSDPIDDLDDPIKNTGRDLRKFSFTWDATYLYFYVERWASTDNITDWWFYMDADADGSMEENEPVLHINWQGNNRSTDVELGKYEEVAVGGDPLISGGVGDGYTMPGDVGTYTTLYSNFGGALSGTEMESRVSWASLGLTGPANLKFHISSSNGVNLPNNILDNMDGPAGGQLFPQDLQVSKTASSASVLGNEAFFYTVTVYNSAIIAFTDVIISDAIPSITNYVSHSAEAGTTFDDSDANSIPDVWNIPSIPANATYTLTINVTGGNVLATTTSTNTATLTSSTETDDESSNDSASVNVDIEPGPYLTMVKDTPSSLSGVKPGENISYTITVTNEGAASTTPVSVTDALSPYTMLRVDTYGPLTPFEFTKGTSNLTMGIPKYSDDNGLTYLYSPLVSGEGGAPAGYDGNVTNWKIEMIGTMDPSNANFDVDYQVQTR